MLPEQDGMRTREVWQQASPWLPAGSITKRDSFSFRIPGQGKQTALASRPLLSLLPIPTGFRAFMRIDSLLCQPFAMNQQGN